MPILMGALSPHPPLIIPEIGGVRRREVSETIASLEELAAEIVEVDPDLLITISPHGPVFKDAISTIDKPELSGNMGEFGHPEVSFTLPSDREFTGQLIENAAANNMEVIDVTAEHMNSYRISTELDHGVLVPLYFLRQENFDAPLVALTMGLLGYNQLYKFGLLIQKTVAELDRRAVILASGDLSHRLKPGAPAGYNPRGEEFDKSLMDLLAENRFQEVLDMDPVLIEKAGECGLRPIIILLGALRELDVNCKVKSYEGPFGVGYGVAGFYIKEVE